MNANNCDVNIIRYILSFIWLSTGAISLGIYPQEESLALLNKVGLFNKAAIYALYLSAIMDIGLGFLTLKRPSQHLWQLQALIIVTYSIVIAIYLPEFLIHPFAPILKNIPILLLLWILYKQGAKSSVHTYSLSGYILYQVLYW